MVRLTTTGCAVVRLSDSIVINKVIAQPDDPPYDGCEFVEIADGQECDIGWYWDGVNFIPPLVVE